MGRANIDFSDQPQGKATLLKIIGNTFILNMVETLSEGHTLAERSGLGNENLHSFIETMFPGPYVAYSGRLLGGDYYKRDEVCYDHGLIHEAADQMTQALVRGRFSTQRCSACFKPCRSIRHKDEGCRGR